MSSGQAKTSDYEYLIKNIQGGIGKIRLIINGGSNISTKTSSESTGNGITTLITTSTNMDNMGSMSDFNTADGGDTSSSFEIEL